MMVIEVLKKLVSWFNLVDNKIPVPLIQPSNYQIKKDIKNMSNEELLIRVFDFDNQDILEKLKQKLDAGDIAQEKLDWIDNMVNDFCPDCREVRCIIRSD